VEGYSGQGSVHGVVEKTEHEAEESLHRRIEAFFADEIGADSWNAIIERIIVAEGRAPKQIIEHIRAVQADVVVMGAHRYGLMELLLGSTSARVIAHSKVPVMVVPVPEGKPADR
jgi:nucleotide-binding universal stress UspA family protein